MANQDQNKPAFQGATHALLDASGKVVDSFEAAAGIRYTDDETGQTFDYVPANDLAKTMLACFGARTLATNEASGHRQKNGNVGTGVGQVADIASRFKGIDEGTWASRERGPIVWDHDTLAQAVANVMEANGLLGGLANSALVTKAKTKLTNGGDAQVAAFRAVKGVEEEYRRLKGRGPQKSAADLIGMLDETAPAPGTTTMGLKL